MTCLNSFKSYLLRPSHYFSAPDLSSAAMFNETKIQLRHVPDSDTYRFFEKDARAKQAISI